MKKIILIIIFCTMAVLFSAPSVAVLPVECSDERIGQETLIGVRKVVENNLKHVGWQIAPEKKARGAGKQYFPSKAREDYCRICKDESWDGMVLSHLYSKMGIFFLEIAMPDKDSGVADSTKRYVMQLTGPLSSDSLLQGLAERLLGETVHQPMVALFSTVSMVPTMPYKSYMACDDVLTTAILSHSCKVLGKATADVALRDVGVVRLSDLTATQARKLLDELQCEALVQLTVKKYNLQEGRQLSRRADRRRIAGQPFLLVEISGEIQVWKGDFEKANVIPFQRVVTSDDVDACNEDGRVDRGIFGQAALRMEVEQAMRDFRR